MHDHPKLNRRTILIAAVPLVMARPTQAAERRLTLRIASNGAALAFKPDHLTCSVNTTVHLYFHHDNEISSDPHDWVLLRPGTESAFVADADRQPTNAEPIPIKDRSMVLAATRMCPKGKTVGVKFILKTPGDYPFVCSVPGHGGSMHGVLTATA